MSPRTLTPRARGRRSPSPCGGCSRICPASRTLIGTPADACGSAATPQLVVSRKTCPMKCPMVGGQLGHSRHEWTVDRLRPGLHRRARPHRRHRSPATFDLPVGMSTPERVHAHREGKIGLGGVLASLPVLWANHPGRSADAVYKPLQLAVAAGGRVSSSSARRCRAARPPPSATADELTATTAPRVTWQRRGSTLLPSRRRQFGAMRTVALLPLRGLRARSRSRSSCRG